MQSYDVGSITLFHLQLKKLWFRKVRKLTQGHTASMCWRHHANKNHLIAVRAVGQPVSCTCGCMHTGTGVFIVDPVQTLCFEPLEAERQGRGISRRLLRESSSQGCDGEAAHVEALRAICETPNQSPSAPPKTGDHGRPHTCSHLHTIQTEPSLFYFSDT